MSAFVPPTLHQALTVTGLTRYMPPTELAALDFALRNGEASVVGPLLSDLANTIKDIPHSYPHATQGDAASVHLHYFKGDSHWYVTELDRDDAAFGFVVFSGTFQSAAPQHINITELVFRAVELDLRWMKRTLGELKQQVLR
jgi:hypothetical protein